MTKKWQKSAMLLAVVMLTSATATQFAGCKPTESGTIYNTYRTVTATMPSNWNELTYQDNNDTQIMSYIASSFFDYDYDFGGNKYNEDGSINMDAIVAGGYTTNYSAATALKDVTSTVDAKWGYTDEQKATGGYAWEITLRNDLKWDDGTAINANSFVYSMQEQLNPDFMNYRANTYYDNIMIKGSKDYLYGGKSGYDAADFLTGDVYDAAKDDLYIWKLNSSSAADATTGTAMSTLRASYNSGYEAYGMTADQTAGEYLVALGNAFGAPIPVTKEEVNALEGKTFTQIKADPALKATFDALVEWWGEGEVGALDFAVMYYVNDEVPWSEVGMYAVGTDKIVVCLDKSYQFLKDDGSLSYLAAYYMSSLPLVKQDLYESCKIAPAEGSTLWTSNYNSTLATTASWGPYKLVEFQSGKFYKLVKNDNWYGYGMEEYKNQYNVTAIECECVPEPSSQWLKFLAGETDDASLDTEHIADYMYSKYTTYTPGTGTFGMQLYGNLSVLKASKNNNGILAIDAFRQAFSLALNRDDVVETIWPGTAVPCYGLMNDQYYYDVENGGVYRYTEQAKKGLLKAYGFTENKEDGTWSNGAELTGLSLDEAYDAMSGYNPTLAKELMEKAYTILTENAETYGYDANKDITLVYGSSVDNAKQRARADYLQGVLDKVCEGTGLQGKIKIKFDASAGSKWSDAFRNGDTQIGFGYGFSGNPFNPFDIVGSFVDPTNNLNYHTYWDTTKVDLELTMPAGDYEGAGQTIKMNLKNWYDCLNGLAAQNNDTYKYNWDAGIAPADVRLEILAALEEQVLTKCYSVMLIGEYNGSLLSPKFSYGSYDYNTFMGFGGMRYLVVNYTDAEWAAYVKANNNDLTAEYKKAA